MELAQKVEIPLPPEAVWDALNDPEVLKQCLPGCEEFSPVEENKFHILIQAKVGPVKAKFNGEVELSNITPPTSYTLSGAGKGGVAGFAKGSANVQLSPATVNGTDGTEMTYEVNAAVGGKLAQIGSRLVNGAAKKMAAEFFTNFVRVVCDDTEGKLEVNLQTLSSDG
ncbi:MAG: carbon monoxide dehydrogenase subunit G [Pseudomonadales bacterium]|nr:carbon monoxide dehydrogenase subunit G [Pseudomonadales bacterium]